MFHRVQFLVLLFFTTCTPLLAQSLDFIERGLPTNAVLERSHPGLRLSDPASNQDPAVAETIVATVSSQATGDVETVTLTETGADSGVFEGRFQLVADSDPTPGLLSSQWQIVPPWYDYAPDQLDASAAGLTAQVTVESVRGGFIDRYGRETDTLALGETIYARLHVAGVDGTLQEDTLAFDVRDFSTFDFDYTDLEDPPIVDIFEGGNLVLVEGSAIAEDRVLQTALGNQVEGRFNQITTTVTDYATVTASRTALVDAVSRPLVTIRPGQEITVEVFDIEANTVSITLDAGQTLDSETVTLGAVGGGLFRASINTGVGGAVAEDGTLDLDAAGGETITASYADGAGGSSASLVSLPQAASRQALFVVGNTSLGAGDQAVYDHLNAAGWTLTVRDDGASSSTDALGQDLVLISSTVSSNQVKAKFRDVTVPALVWEPYVLDDMAMTATTAGLSYGSEQNQTDITIRDANHPLSAGFEGAVTVTSAAGKITYGRAGRYADGVARVGSRPERLATLAYEQGQEMVGLTAPARRVSTFLSDTTAATLTNEGWRLFDAAVCWAVRCDGEPISSFTYTVSGTGGGPYGRTVSFDASTSKAADGATIVDFSWTFGDRGHGDGESISHVYQSESYSDEHGFLATLTVTDSLGRSSTSSQVLWLSAHRSVLFVTRSELLDAGDAAIVERLRLHGHRAVPIGHGTVTTADANGHDAVYISSTVNSSQVGAAFTQTTLPVATWETHLFDDLLMTAAGGANYGRDLGQPGLNIVDDQHPILDFYFPLGQVEVDITGELGWGQPGLDADVLAVSPADPSHATLFAYDDHHQLVDGSQAPHRRLGLWLGDDGAAALTRDGREILDGVIRWTVSP